MDKKPFTDNQFQSIMKRIHNATGTKTQVELADVLGIRQSSISDAKRRGRIPDSWLMELYRQFNINPHWILDAAEPRQVPLYNESMSIVENPALGTSYEEIFQKILDALREPGRILPNNSSESARRYVEHAHKQWENLAMSAEDFPNLSQKLEESSLDLILRHVRFMYAKILCKTASEASKCASQQ